VTDSPSPSHDDTPAAAPPIRGAGLDLHALVTELFPICRSITGNGLRRTLDIVGQHIPLDQIEVPSGTHVFDWVVPREWNIRDAYIRDRAGRRLVDFQACNLHVLNYSSPVDRVVPLEELRRHLFTDPLHPAWIPYRTSYYAENWGFCVTQAQFDSMTDEEYEVRIDASLTDGALTLGECYLPGETTDEVIVSCHACHPSLANDNLSGISVAVFLAKRLMAMPRRYSYRLLFIPGTIGAIAWLSRNRDCAARIKHGLVLTCVGDDGAFHYKKSRRGDAEIDRAMAHVLEARGVPHEVREFQPYGYDERQYCSPGFNLPVGCLMRSVWGEFPEYHTSADNLEFVTPGALQESLEVCTAAIDILERNRTYRSASPFGEPALGRRGLYSPSRGGAVAPDNLARLWVMNLADGAHSLLDIAERAAMPFDLIAASARELAAHGLLAEERGAGR
jgi:aminopeptidase-like protein